MKVSRNGIEQPIRAKACVLAGYLGIVARNATLLSINYDSWYEMLNSNKNQAMDYFKEKFSLKILDDYLKKPLGKKLRDHKNSWKKNISRIILALKRSCKMSPPVMLRYQWKDAVRFWSSNKGEV
ncbi:hypothetical protein GQ457_05G025670 [Hibiscus cannabinus]